MNIKDSAMHKFANFFKDELDQWVQDLGAITSDSAMVPFACLEWIVGNAPPDVQDIESKNSVLRAMNVRAPHCNWDLTSSRHVIKNSGGLVNKESYDETLMQLASQESKRFHLRVQTVPVLDCEIPKQRHVPAIDVAKVPTVLRACKHIRQSLTRVCARYYVVIHVESTAADGSVVRVGSVGPWMSGGAFRRGLHGFICSSFGDDVHLPVGLIGAFASFFTFVASAIGLMSWPIRGGHRMRVQELVVVERKTLRIARCTQSELCDIKLPFRFSSGNGEGAGGAHDPAGPDIGDGGDAGADFNLTDELEEMMGEASSGQDPAGCKEYVVCPDADGLHALTKQAGVDVLRAAVALEAMLKEESPFIPDHTVAEMAIAEAHANASGVVGPGADGASVVADDEADDHPVDSDSSSSSSSPSGSSGGSSSSKQTRGADKSLRVQWSNVQCSDCSTVCGQLKVIKAASGRSAYVQCRVRRSDGGYDATGPLTKRRCVNVDGSSREAKLYCTLWIRSRRTCCGS